MTATLTPKANDDPHDFVVVPSDAVRVVPAEQEISDLLRGAAARHHPDPQPFAAPDPVAAPPVDATFRPAAAGDVPGSGNGRSIGRRAVRAFAALLLAACIGGAAIAWQTFGYAGKKLFLKWTPQFVMTSLPLEKWGLGAPSTSPDVEEAAAEAAPPQSAPTAQAAADAVAPAAPPVDPAPSLQSMARNLASVTQEVEQLKISIEQLKASQQQMSRDVAKDVARPDAAKPDAAKTSENRASVPNARPKLSALPPQPPVARPRKPAPPFPPAQTAAAPPLPQAATPYAPRQPEPPPPPAVTQLPPEPGFTSVPRPPMPVQ